MSAEGRIVVRVANNEAMRSPAEQSGEGTITFAKIANKKPLCGEVFYVSVRAEAGDNYESSSGWSDPLRVAVPFAAPSVTVSASASDGAIFTYTALGNSVEGYVVKYRVGSSGEWKTSADSSEWTIKVVGLRADTPYTVHFRAEKDGIVGAVSTVELRTLRAPVAAEKVKVDYDWTTNSLAINVDEIADNEGLEYCLCTASGEVVSAWSASPNFDKIEKDSTYILKIRYAQNEEDEKLVSEEMTIEIDTHKPKVPLTWRSVLSDWFLVIVGVVMLIPMIICIVSFAKKKKKIDREDA